MCHVRSKGREPKHIRCFRQLFSPNVINHLCAKIPQLHKVILIFLRGRDKRFTYLRQTSLPSVLIIDIIEFTSMHYIKDLFLFFQWKWSLCLSRNKRISFFSFTSSSSFFCAFIKNDASINTIFQCVVRQWTLFHQSKLFFTGHRLYLNCYMMINVCSVPGSHMF